MAAYSFALKSFLIAASSLSDAFVVYSTSLCIWVSWGAAETVMVDITKDAVNAVTIISFFTLILYPSLFILLRAAGCSPTGLYLIPV